MEPKAKKPQQDGQKGSAHSDDHVDPRVTVLEATIKDLEAQITKLTDLAARAQADLQNAKVRMTKDRDEIGKFASEGALVRLLPVIDHFQRAFQHLPGELKSHEWVKGISAIEQDFMTQVKALGLKKIESLGKPVDASCHEVLMTGEGEEGKILEVFEEGYELNGKVLRVAKVRVGDGSISPPSM